MPSYWSSVNVAGQRPPSLPTINQRYEVTLKDIILSPILLSELGLVWKASKHLRLNENFFLVFRSFELCTDTVDFLYNCVKMFVLNILLVFLLCELYWNLNCGKANKKMLKTKKNSVTIQYIMLWIWSIRTVWNQINGFRWRH